MRRAATVAAVVIGLTLAAANAHAGSSDVPRWKSWLCFPGHAHDWCAVDLTTTVIDASGPPKTLQVSVAQQPPIDCFYVYPTVSEERRGNADLKAQDAEKTIAIVQAAYFSHLCRVYAPLYRQTTAYEEQYHGSHRLAAADVLAAWKDYLAHDNDGRGVVLIGHSQGAYILDGLIKDQIDASPSERRLLVSAILLGGGVVVGDFAHVPPCASTSQTGCVVAYEAWDRSPPAKPTNGKQLCVDPAALGGGSAAITPIFPGLNPEGIVPYGSRYVAYDWVEFPHLYTARCVHDGDRAWLLVTRIHTAGDRRPTVQEALGPTQGLHAADVNLTLANLVALVGSESRAWRAHH